MPAYFFVLLSNWPVFPIALMDLIGVAVGIALYVRRRDWPPLLVIAGFGIRLVSSVGRLAFFLAGYMITLNYYAATYGYGYAAYDPITGALMQQTMNVVVAVGSVLALGLLQAGIWHGLTRKNPRENE
jgi:hypothetical protein